ncbi:MAG: ImmA/IrrE family metallo-endopeptidase [Oscillospiraceae bacterium]
MQRIIDLAQSVIDEYGGRDIFETAENSGARVWFRSIGTLKGFYVFENGKRYIIINSGLSRMMKRVVCAHEFGHDMLHRELSAGGIRDSTLFLDSNKTEREANLFAASLLIPDSDILSEISYCRSVEALAYELDLPTELVEYKLELLNYQGYNFRCSPVKSDFLK